MMFFQVVPPHNEFISEVAVRKLETCAKRTFHAAMFVSKQVFSTFIKPTKKAAPPFHRDVTIAGFILMRQIY